ncbi:MAG: hypothetical protein HPPSJP_3860 [Candidatus Hepatoplasma scabrum]|nr:MAG: hypothetical protein HPPSJP_3860 [Candidatus Hepatoplasma sp.]
MENKFDNSKQDKQSESRKISKVDFKTTFLNVEYLRVINKYKLIIDDKDRLKKRISKTIEKKDQLDSLNNKKDFENFVKEIDALEEKLVLVNEEENKYFARIKEFESIFKNDYFIELKEVYKNFGKKEVLKGVNLKIKKGERVSIIGHNGSGKTTLADIISGVKNATSGELIYYFGKSREDLGDSIGIQFQKLNYPEGYKVSEIIVFFNRMVNKKIRYTNQELKILIREFGIDKFYNKNLISLSGGQKQRVNLFLAFIKKPKLLILDELSTGLDINIYERVVKLFKKYIEKNNVTVILISHNLDEIKNLTNKVFLLKNGKILLEMPSNNLNESNFYDFIKRNEEEIDFEFKFNIEKEYIRGRFYNSIYRFREAIKKKYNEVLKFKLYIDRKNTKIIEIKTGIDYYQDKIDSLNEKKDKFIEQTIELNQSKKRTKNLIDRKINRIDRKIWRENSKLNKIEDKIYEIQEKSIDIYQRLIEILSIDKDQNKRLLHRQKQSKEELAKNKKIAKKNKKIILNEEYLNTIKKDISHKQDVIEEDKIYLNNQYNLLKEIPSQYPQIFNNELYRNYQKEQIRIINVKKYFGIKPAVDGVMLNFNKGERVAITGPNGSGKTTLTEILATTLKSTTGRIKYYFAPTKSIAKHEIGMQFQESKFPSDLNVKDILLLFLNTSMWAISEEELWKLVNIFKLDHILKSNGDILSGGERQRLNVIIALLKQPSLLILDEISTGLDVESIEEINKYIKYYLDQTNANLVLISHNPAEVYRLVDKLIILKEGKVVQIHNVKKMTLANVRKIFVDIYKDINDKLINLNSLNFKTDTTENSYNISEKIKDKKIEN